jgi:hypothetical protein
MRRALAMVTAIAFAALGLGACGSSLPAGVTAACDAAFKTAENAAGGGQGVESLDPAVRLCATVTEWQAAWAAHPKAHGSEVVPLDFLGGRCLESSLADTALCKDPARAP